MDLGFLKNQSAALARGGIFFVAGVVTGRGWLEGETALMIAGAILTAVSTGWGGMANTNKAIVQAASQVPEVTSMSIADPVLASAAKHADPQTHVREIAKERS